MSRLSVTCPEPPWSEENPAFAEVPMGSSFPPERAAGEEPMQAVKLSTQAQHRLRLLHQVLEGLERNRSAKN